ncbi:hypothetical protein G3M48_002314, partial [Beauveria asiatica]
MKTYTNPLPKPPPSSRPRPFDPWNSSSTGHQRREASRRETDGVSETSWRASRALKINQQLKTQSHVPPPPPPPPAASQERKPTLPQQQQRQQQPKSVMEMLVRPGSMRETMSAAAAAAAAVAEKENPEVAGKRGESAGQSLIFAGLVVHVNGSTAPLVSDHKLKTLLAAHGARVALHLARRHVTHVVLGRPAGGISGGSGGGGGGGGSSSSSSSSAGCGGGLAGTKMDREIRRRGGHGIKYVGVE